MPWVERKVYCSLDCIVVADSSARADTPVYCKCRVTDRIHEAEHRAEPGHTPEATNCQSKDHSKSKVQGNGVVLAMDLCKQ